MRLAEKIVELLLDEGWLSDRWNDVKRITSIGHDEYGLGKNTEKGWVPKHRLVKGKHSVRSYRHTPGDEPDEGKLWNLDNS